MENCILLASIESGSVKASFVPRILLVNPLGETWIVWEGSEEPNPDLKSMVLMAQELDLVARRYGIGFLDGKTTRVLCSGEAEKILSKLLPKQENGKNSLVLS